MNRERVLKGVLVAVGLLFSAAVIPMWMMFARDPALAMMLIVYATLGIFLLLAARNPGAHGSLIAFTAWSSFAHASLMAVQVYMKLIQPMELGGVAFFFLVGIGLLALAPAKESTAGTGLSRSAQKQSAAS